MAVTGAATLDYLDANPEARAALTAYLTHDGDFDLLLRRAYANGHRDGFGCGQEAGALGMSECEHVGSLDTGR
jgi:hypothetical protein